jgi:succinate-acetate transporter protein
MISESITHLKDTTGNPAPLGLLGFGMTTVLLNLHNAGFFELNTMILAMGICYGGIAQVIAGIMEWKKGNTFATTAFTSYGLFWLSLVATILLTKLGWAAPSNPAAMGAYLTAWVQGSAGLIAYHHARVERRAQFSGPVLAFTLRRFLL